MAKLYGKRINTFDELMGDTPKVEPLVKAPAVNTDAKVEQTETPEKEPIKTVPTPKFDKEQYLGGVFDQRPSAPVYNTTAEQQDQAMMKAQTLGNLLALLGDVGGVALGANVARRNPKPLEPYMQSIQNRKAQFEKDKRIFDRQEFEDKLREAMGKSAAETAAEQTAYDRDRDKKEWEHKLGREKEEDSRWWANYKRGDDRAKEKMELDWAKLNKDKSDAKKPKAEPKADLYANIDGKEIGIEEGVVGRMAQEAANWLGENSDRDYTSYIDAVQAGGKSDQLVREYMMQRSDKDPVFKAFLLQIEDGIKDFGQYLAQDKTEGVIKPPVYSKTKADKAPSSTKKKYNTAGEY